VDVKTEAAIVEAMERLAQGRTTFIIAHRHSALKHCDLVLRIEHGRVEGLEPVWAPVDVDDSGRLESAADSRGSRANA
jgi:ABC-type protease/lipase transport system fused ATPase/permease subunit